MRARQHPAAPPGEICGFGMEILLFQDVLWNIIHPDRATKIAGARRSDNEFIENESQYL